MTRLKGIIVIMSTTERSKGKQTAAEQAANKESLQREIDQDREDRRAKEQLETILAILGAVAIITAIICLFLGRDTTPPNTDPHVGWVVTESNDFGPVYRHMCQGTTLIIEHTTHGVHTPTYFENDTLCVG